MTRLIPSAEGLTVEFKSDRQKLPDRELLETVVAFANSQGGVIYLGVEDDGRVTGLHPDHRNVGALAAFIANRTSPPVSARVELNEFWRTPLLKAFESIEAYFQSQNLEPLAKVPGRHSGVGRNPGFTAISGPRLSPG
jgi:hypothetical protein